MDQPHIRALLAEVDQARTDPLDSPEEVKPGHCQDGNEEDIELVADFALSQEDDEHPGENVNYGVQESV